MFLLLMLSFSLVINFLGVLDVFPHMATSGVDSSDTESAVQHFAGFSSSTVTWVFAGATTLAFAGVVLLSWATKTITPIGIHLFATVFWGSWINTVSIFSMGGSSGPYIPADFLIIFTVGVAFLFIAAVIGMLTGSG